MFLCGAINVFNSVAILVGVTVGGITVTGVVIIP